MNEVTRTDSGLDAEMDDPLELKHFSSPVDVPTDELWWNFPRSDAWR